ncbi:cytochrome P450 CYP72A616-like [Lycium ferocissimum]|uniref:cytochrome P450 CYP72A616-like n=1 Tax=Lycium ferocissimum TaxID=112874 RepID=UPI002814AEED|nr:cytochrome P450 CYP72A616-like [Lycium ferocissimum]
MANLVFLSLLLFPLLILSYFLLKISYSILIKPKLLEKRLKLQGFKGTRYKLLLGDLKDVGNQMNEAWSKPIGLTHAIVPRVDPFTHYMVQKYGKISLSWLGASPRLIIMDPTLIKEVLLNKQGHFHLPPLNPLVLILTKGLTTLQGEKWAMHRKIINPAFHLDKLKGMIPTLAESCAFMIEKWMKSISPEGTSEIDIWPEFQDLTGDIISRTAFGSSYEDGKKILELQKELQLLVIEAMGMLYIPGFRFVPTKKNRRRKYLDRRITSMLKTIVDTKENMIRTGQTREDDLLGLLLQFNNENNSLNNVNNSYQMTKEDIIEECKQFYLAGHETTSSLLTWTLIVLAIHQDWQEKARQEVLQVVRDKNPDAEAISHLKTVSMILNEVLRLYPPVIALYKRAYKECRIGDLSIPAGVDLTLPIMLINRETELWGDDAEEFKPERFAEGISHACKDPTQMAFMPFGWGPRTCIGQNFSMIEAKVALSMILKQFSFKLSPAYAHAPYTVMTLQPQHGAQIMFHPLN